MGTTTAPLRPLHAALAVLGVLGAALAAAQTLAPTEGPPAALDRTAVPAAGRHHALVEVARFGRYAITVSSEQGVGLQLVGRMEGPGTVVGSPGVEDGRLDTFLDRGQYRVVTHGHDQASGEAALAVHAFREPSDSPAPQLVEHKLVSATLGDFEQRSYWLQVDAARWVHLEAAGRNLRDLRLWRDGSWLADAAPDSEVVEPLPGRPLLACRLAARLEPGLYLVTAYGGAGQAWADASDEHPFHLRLGIPRLGVAGRAYHQVGPFGLDRWLVPVPANFFRLELPEARPAELGVGSFVEDSPYQPGDNVDIITKESREPAAELMTPYMDEGLWAVTVRAEQGQPYVLQHFEASWEYSFQRAGEHWISTIHSGHAEDSVDATGILAHWAPSGLEREPLREQTIAVDSTTSWASRCNLLEDLDVFLHVRETGTYRISSRGTAASFRLEPFMVYRPDDFEPPPFRSGDSDWELDRGYYVLTASPVEKGVLELAVTHRNLLDSVLDLFGAARRVSEAGVQASVRFPSVQLQGWPHHYVLYLNHQPGVHAGVILRELPLDLREPLPLTLRPGEEVEVPFRVPEPVVLQAVLEDGTPLAHSLDGGEPGPLHELSAGRHSATLRNTDTRTVVCTLEAVPRALLASEPLPPLPASTLAGLPDFPLLTAADPRHLDLERDQSATFLVQAPADALYRLETSGLLDTAGNLRSRVVTSLARSAGGGSGRNFFLHQFLDQGDYQLTINTQGSSAGHLGLSLTRTDPSDGGELRQGLAARVTLDQGQSVVYRFTIAEEGRYRLRAFGLGGSARCRLEDGEGWPVERPNLPASFTRSFAPGDYRLLLLPEPVAGRRLTLLERLTEPPRFEGHGPHCLPLDTEVEHVWEEPEGDGERVPDRWEFALAGAGEVLIRLNQEMHGRLLRLTEGGTTEVALVPPLRGFAGRLEPGHYRLEAECARRNNRVTYTVAVEPQMLLAGLEREVSVPTTLPVAVGDDGLVEIYSLGSLDVNARLEDGEGRPIAFSDDRANDWNFHLTGRFAPGPYTLVVQPVGSHGGTTTVRMEARQEQVHDPLALPLDTGLEPGAAVHLLPLSGLAGELLLVSARAEETVGLAVEAEAEPGAWRTLASAVDPTAHLEVPLQSGQRLRLRLWSVDRREGPVRLMATALDPIRIGEPELARGVRLQAVPGFEPALAVAAVESQLPGTLRLGASDHGLRWSSRPGQALRPEPHGLLPLHGSRAWLAVDGSGGGLLSAERVSLEPAPAPALQLSLDGQAPVTVDVAPSREGPLVVLASAMNGQPGLRLVEGASAAAASSDLSATAIAPGAAAAVALAGSRPALATWIAVPSADPVEVRLSAHRARAMDMRRADWGSTADELRPGAARALELPAGSKRLRLTLTPALVAAVVAGGRVESVHFGGDRALVETWEGTGERLWLHDCGDAGGSYALDILPAAEVSLVVGPDAPFEQLMSGSGTLRLQVAPAAFAGAMVHVRGASGDATLVGGDGRVLRGTALAAGVAPSTLLVPHAAGPLLVWIGPLKRPESGLWDGVEPPLAEPVTVPARIHVGQAARAYAVTTSEPTLLTLRCPAPLLLRLISGGAERSLLTLDERTVHLALPDGRGQLLVRTLASMGGELELTASPITSVGEGLGPEVLLGPGSGHAFRFTVQEDGPVGVGVRAEEDTVECALLRIDGELLGSGVVQMHELEAADYLLLVDLPADGNAVRARPAVVGIERPPTGPPEDVIREYLTMEGVSP